MSNLTRIIRRGYSTIRDGKLLQVLHSRIKEDQSLDFKGHKDGSLGNFELSWNGPRSIDVILRRKFDSGEEIAVSALLGAINYAGEDSFPYKPLMKICIKKPDLSTLLQFDCVIENEGHGLSELLIKRACCLPSTNCFGESPYRGPVYSDLDPQLQAMFKEYLNDRGIGEDLVNFIILHLHRKDNDQYVNWLSRVEAMVSKTPNDQC
ncbi:hypothetical protein ACHQM5_001945 [Ranunculus cassubicifolius]